MTAGRSAAILHIPHGSISIPKDLRDSFLLDEQALQQELLLMTDWHTEDLFGVPGLQRIIFPVCRLVVDPERFLEDEEEVMAARGMGVIYTRTSGGDPLRVPPSPEERARLIDRFYWPHHRRLSEAVDGALEEHGYALVIDCHSFPSQPLPCDLDQDPSRPDLCIGTDPLHSPGWLRDATTSAFRAADSSLSIGVDRPYSGALVPLEAWGQDPRVLAVMIEMNRRLYLDEATGQPHALYPVIHLLIREAVAQLVIVVQERFVRTPSQGEASLSGIASPGTIQSSPQPCFPRPQEGAAMKPKRIILIRHGQSEGNLDPEIYAQKPDYALLLTELGHRQAQDAGLRLRDLVGEGNIRFYVPPLFRTRQTFREIARAFPKSQFRHSEEPRLREQEWGHLRDREACDAVDKARDAYGTFYYRIPDGESAADVYDRVSDFSGTLFRDFEKESFPENAVMVTHGMTIRLFLMRWFHWTVEDFEQLSNPHNCEFLVLEQRADGRYDLASEPRRRRAKHGWRLDDGTA